MAQLLVFAGDARVLLDATRPAASDGCQQSAARARLATLQLDDSDARQVLAATLERTRAALAERELALEAIIADAPAASARRSVLAPDALSTTGHELVSEVPFERAAHFAWQASPHALRSSRWSKRGRSG